MGEIGTRLLSRWPRRAMMCALASTGLVGGLLSLSVSPVQAADDYPWAWQGQCPIVPQEPIEEPTPTPNPLPVKPGESPAPVVVPPPPPPPLLDPVSGHLYDPRGPKPTCASRVWSINGFFGDQWGFVLRNCTSFVAWRLQERNQLDFTNALGSRHWGDAENWDDVASDLGYRVDSVPAIGAVAQSDDGRVGHVAWVSDIGPGTVTIEEYNHAVPGGYGVRTVPVGSFRYLHLADVAPSPLIGSARPIVSVPDGLGESWTARVDGGGTLWVARPGQRPRVVGPRDSFSPIAAPSLSLDHRGRPWVASTARDGHVLAGTTRGSRFVLRAVATSAMTSSPALTQSGTARPVLATISPTGTLLTRRFTRQGRWSRPQQVGWPDSWATHTSPVLGADGTGRTWLVAVGARGATFAQSLGRGQLVRLTGAAAAVTSTPALTLSDGILHLHQISSQGRLTMRTLSGLRWSRPTAYDGDWSPYASPAAGVFAGQLYVAAVDRIGAVVVRAAAPGEQPALSARIGSSGDPTRSPGLVTRNNAGVFVVADAPGRATRARLLTRPATAVVGDSAPTRAGFTP